MGSICRDLNPFLDICCRSLSETGYQAMLVFWSDLLWLLVLFSFCVFSVVQLSHVSSLTRNKRGTGWQICLFKFIIYALISLDLEQVSHCCSGLISEVKCNVMAKETSKPNQNPLKWKALYTGLHPFHVKDNLNCM